ERFALSFSTGLFLSVVLSVGGYCQTVFVNGLLGDATSIYDALIPQGFSTSIPFLDWLKSFYIYWYMPLSILACYIALAYKNIRSLFLALSIGIFFELIIIDFWILYTSDQLDSFPINLLSNFFGCPLVAMLICLLLMSKASFSRYITRN